MTYRNRKGVLEQYIKSIGIVSIQAINSLSFKVADADTDMKKLRI